MLGTVEKYRTHLTESLCLQKTQYWEQFILAPISNLLAEQRGLFYDDYNKKI